jgi:hypothetical protein
MARLKPCPSFGGTFPFEFFRGYPNQFVQNAVLQELKGLRENSHCVVPSGLVLREILPGTPVPGSRLSRPFGTDSSRGTFGADSVGAPSGRSV